MSPRKECPDSDGLGWAGCVIVLFLAVFGGFVIPTVLIGIVSISFDESTRRGNNKEVIFDIHLVGIVVLPNIS
jgi:hypothetical protein